MHMNYIEFPLFKLLAQIVEIGIKYPWRNRGSRNGTTGMNRDRPTDKSHVPVLRTIFGTRGREDIFHLVPHAGEILTQREEMAIYTAGINIIVRGDLYNFHSTVS